MQVLHFNQFYTKLNYPLFPTLRGTFWFRKKIGTVLQVKVMYYYAALAYIYCKKKTWIEQLPLEFLQYDIHPETIKDKFQYADKINRLRRQTARNRYEYEQIDIYTPMTLLVMHTTQNLSDYFT